MPRFSKNSFWRPRRAAIILDGQMIRLGDDESPDAKINQTILQLGPEGALAQAKASADSAAAAVEKAKAEAEALKAELAALATRQKPMLLENPCDECSYENIAKGCGGSKYELQIAPDDSTNAHHSKVDEWWNDRAKGLFLPPGYRVTLFEHYDSQQGGAGKRMTWTNYTDQPQCINLIKAGMTRSSRWGLVSTYVAVDVRKINVEQLAREKEELARTLEREADAQLRIMKATQSAVQTYEATRAATAAKAQQDIDYWKMQAEIAAKKTVQEQAALRQAVQAQYEAEQQLTGTSQTGTGWILAATGAAAAALLAIVVVIRRRRRG